jgi:hypothetical protein
MQETLEILGYSRAFNASIVSKYTGKTPDEKLILSTLAKSEAGDFFEGEGPYKIVLTPEGEAAEGLAGSPQKRGLRQDLDGIDEVFLNFDTLEGILAERYAELRAKSSKDKTQYLPLLCARVMPTPEEILGSYGLLKLSDGGKLPERVPGGEFGAGVGAGGGGGGIGEGGGARPLEGGYETFEDMALEGGSVVGSVVGSVLDGSVFGGGSVARSLIGTQLTHLEDNTQLDQVPPSSLWDTNNQAQQFSILNTNSS